MTNALSWWSVCSASHLQGIYSWDLNFQLSWVKDWWSVGLKWAGFREIVILSPDRKWSFSSIPSLPYKITVAGERGGYTSRSLSKRAIGLTPLTKIFWKMNSPSSKPISRDNSIPLLSRSPTYSVEAIIVFLCCSDENELHTQPFICHHKRRVWRRFALYLAGVSKLKGAPSNPRV